jgi:hypothetical protein
MLIPLFVGAMSWDCHAEGNGRAKKKRVQNNQGCVYMAMGGLAIMVKG